MSVKSCPICKRIFTDDEYGLCCSLQCKKVYEWHKKIKKNYGIEQVERIKIVDPISNEVLELLDRVQSKKMAVIIARSEKKYLLKRGK